MGVGVFMVDDFVVLVVDFVYGEDGFGGVRGAYETRFEESAVEYRAGREAVDFIVEMCVKYLGEVMVLVFVLLINIVLMFWWYFECLEIMGEFVVFGGAFEVNGNVNSAAEVNILGDFEVVDEVFGVFECIFVVGFDVMI